MTTKINLSFPKHWNQCTAEQLELIANVMREQVEREDRYHPFSMQNVKIALFFLLSGLEIVAGPNPRVPVEEQYYTCRLREKNRWKRWFRKSETFSLYLWQINYWLSPKAKTKDKDSAEYIAAGSGLLDWIDSDGKSFLTRFPYTSIRRRKTFSLARKFCGPLADLDGFSWAQYRFASDIMNSYMKISNDLVKMQKAGTFGELQLMKQFRAADLSRAMFLATIFNGKTKYVDSNTGVVKHGYRYESNQCSDNAQYFRHFPDDKWQVILFWWTGIMHQLSKRYPHVFKVQKTQNMKPSTPLEVYTATTATMQKYTGLTEDQVNHQSYSLVLEHLERMSKENEELERMKNRK